MPNVKKNTCTTQPKKRTRTSAYDAVLFDCDGTLADTQVIYDLSIYCVLKRVDKKFTRERYSSVFDGKCWAVCLEQFYSKKITAKIIEVAFQIATITLRECTKSNQGTMEVLKKLSKTNIQLGVCSNTTEENLQDTLERTKLLQFFNPSFIFSGDSVKNLKPNPEIYLKAAKKVKITPKRCLAIEDSIGGTLAAVAAGMDVAVYCGSTHIFPKSKSFMDYIKSVAGDQLIIITDNFTQIFNAIYEGRK